MPNDAKLGLVVGVILVLVVAVVFFQKDHPTSTSGPAARVPPAAHTVSPGPADIRSAGPRKI